MFVLTDYTTNARRMYTVNDVKDIGDIILGITGDEEVAKRAVKDAGDMYFGDVIIGNPYYVLECIKEIENE